MNEINTKVDWTKEAEAMFSTDSKYLKFPNDGSEHIVKFLKNPEKHEFQSRGKNVKGFDFTVLSYKQEKILGVSSTRLINKLIEENRKKPIIGSTFRIKALGVGTSRNWEVERIQ